MVEIFICECSLHGSSGGLTIALHHMCSANWHCSGQVTSRQCFGGPTTPVNVHVHFFIVQLYGFEHYLYSDGPTLGRCAIVAYSGSNCQNENMCKAYQKVALNIFPVLPCVFKLSKWCFGQISTVTSRDKNQNEIQ